MIMIRKYISSIFFALIAVFYAEAQDEPDKPIRPVTSAYTFAYGSSEVADTYLSPIIYSGWNLALAYERMQAMAFNPADWVMRLKISADASRGTNYVRNGAMWRGDLAASWAMMHRWKIPAGITAGIGPSISVSSGAIYNPRNGNNPAAAKAAITADVSAYATRMFRLAGTRILARLETSTPLIGAFFSQQYGELYYEIWLGNHSGLVHCAWPGSYRRFDTSLTADIELGSTWLRVGYRNYFHSSKVCDITTRAISNSFVIGISGEWFSIRNNSGISPRTRVISALY